MKISLRPPKYLPEVLQAIQALRETGGSNSNRIVSHIRASSGGTYDRSRNVTTQVRRALNHAIANGIVKQRAGKFRISLKILDPLKKSVECRRRRRKAKGRKRRRRRGRTRSLTARSYRSMSVRRESNHGVPVRELRRRGKKRGGKRRKRRRRRAISSIPKQLSTSQKGSKSNSADDLQKEIVYPDDIDNDESPIPDDHKCDNPECLCNVKDETEEDSKFDSTM